MAAGTGTTVLASSDTDQEVVVGKNDKPYLALGKDLTSSQRDTVLDLLGVDEDKLDEYDVIYITNDQETQISGRLYPEKRDRHQISVISSCDRREKGKRRPGNYKKY